MEWVLYVLLAFFPTSTFLYVVKEDQVSFYLHTKNSAEIQITADNFATIDATKTFHFIAHGWIAGHETQWVQNITAAYLEQADCNVIQVDWSEPADEPHYVSSNNTKGVGAFVGKFISKLIKELGANPANINLVGHSLGSHVAGFAGKQVIQEVGVPVGRITGTDPARRPFENSLITDNDRLSSGDAAIVVAIHTDAGFRGFLKALGTIDFYPNGGVNPQPGCEDSSDTHVCSHNIANEFLIEAIRNPIGFTAVKCDSYENYLNGLCDSGEKVNLGGNFVNSIGVFYFVTNSKPPYSKG